MECLRGQGLMVEDQFFDLEGTQGFMWMKGWRCMNCGHAADPVIEANHRLHEATVRMQPSEETEHEDAHGALRVETGPRVAADGGVKHPYPHDEIPSEQGRTGAWLQWRQF